MSNRRDDQDFEEINAYAEAKGYEWIPAGGFVTRDDAGRIASYRSFEIVALEWHVLFIDQARTINHAEMWGE